MFVDELTIYAQAGDGGNGVVRWLREKSKPLGGPAGGNGGNGGSVFMRAVRDIGLLARYAGVSEFRAQSGEDGAKNSCHGHDGDDYILDVPVGSIVTRLDTKERFELLNEGEQVKILSGGRGGLGNEHFKSSTNRTPEESTPGKAGDRAEFLIEVELAVDIGLVGLPNAGKSSLLNAITNAHSRVGSYPFTTLEPHLGSLYGFVIADIPGLIEGAAGGKGLGHKFLRHVRRTRMVVHCVSSESEDPESDYQTVTNEIELFDPEISKKTTWIVLTKSDLVDEEHLLKLADTFKKFNTPVYVISIHDPESLKKFADDVVRSLREGSGSATMRST